VRPRAGCVRRHQRGCGSHRPAANADELASRQRPAALTQNAVVARNQAIDRCAPPKRPSAPDGPTLAEADLAPAIRRFR
jgi:hypothetical protein